MPIKWKKVAGGLSFQWIGADIDLTTYSLGLSVARAQWLSDWIDRAVQRRTVSVQDLPPF